MKNKKTIFHPIKLIGALVFLMAFTLNIQTSLNGEWELVNVGLALGSGGTGDDGGGSGSGPGSFMEMKTERCSDGTPWFVCRPHEWRGCSVSGQTVCSPSPFNGESFIN